MVYVMQFYVDGACRGNGRPGSAAAAAACLFSRNGSYQSRVLRLRRNPAPTNQRAEICAIILALQWALEKHQTLSTSPYLDITICSDSKYAVDSMTTWINNWIDKDWYNAAGRLVANHDLFQRALALENKLSRLGRVKYVWIPREENEEADSACKEALDEL
ncbi:hypothetical protein TWF718_009854 [Orbilia javanica]|uniref:ribonuclease H n=1 Tax=Orbilia javanica TaxID=47235 RepID=A0AAN8MQE6_9PEZI